jgi:hypothetical protein
MRTRIWIAWAVMLAVGLACASSSSSTSGSAIGGSESCNRSGDAGTCTGSYSKISGTYTKTVKVDRIHVNDAVPVDITVAVESGTLRASAKAPDSTLAAADATPGNPATVSGMATGGLNQFTVTFEAVGGEAAGVTYTIAYQMP